MRGSSRKLKIMCMGGCGKDTYVAPDVFYNHFYTAESMYCNRCYKRHRQGVAWHH